MLIKLLLCMRYVLALEIYIEGDRLSLLGEIISNGQRQTDKQVITTQSDVYVLGTISTENCGYTWKDCDLDLGRRKVTNGFLEKNKADTFHRRTDGYHAKGGEDYFCVDGIVWTNVWMLKFTLTVHVGKSEVEGYARGFFISQI